MSASFHPRPSPHFVFDADTWKQVKARAAHLVQPEYGVPTAGVTAMFSGLSVYVDGCPWNCEGDGQ